MSRRNLVYWCLKANIIETRIDRHKHSSLTKTAEGEDILIYAYAIQLRIAKLIIKLILRNYTICIPCETAALS